ncbi:MAG: lipase family alpha/beta hydrolase [Planctomycetota bacterium]|jgi:pimeloyl-ACP methyl ester carboxylesterase
MRRLLIVFLLLAFCPGAGLIAGRLPAWAQPPNGVDEPTYLDESVPVPTMGGLQFWADEVFFHRWRIQRNAVTGHYRLLDGNFLRHAWGSYEHCRARLEAIKNDRQLPPMRGKAVIVLHGLTDTRIAMARLCKYLESTGTYTALNVAYPSTRGSVAEHARSLRKIIENLDGIEEINFVGHSMGNIVIRHYLAGQDGGGSGRLPDPRIKRFVMLGPPNHGSAAATRFADNKLVGAVLGESSQELGPHWIWLESELVTPQCEFGIIAGGLGNEEGFNPLIPGDDDGVVTVASTRLAGASDYVRLPLLHPLLPLSSQAMKYALQFLDRGYFVSPGERRPIVEE